MRYYSYDMLTAAYLPSAGGEAEESPLEPGVFHVPAWSTLEEPPEQEGKTPYFMDKGWVLLDKPKEEVAATILGEAIAPPEKAALFRNAAAKNIDIAARVFGFESMADAVSFAGDESTQRGLDGTALKAWRKEVLAKIDELVAWSQNETDPLPTDEQFNTIFSGTPFNRVFLSAEGAKE